MLHPISVFRSALPCLALALLLSIYPGTGVRAQNFSAMYQASDAEVQRVTATGFEAFQARHRSQNAAGFRLTDLETARRDDGRRDFIGLYTKSPLEDHLEVAHTWSDFIVLKRAKVKEGYTMIDVTGVVLNESDTDFYGVWVKENNPTIHKVWLLDSYESVLDRTKKMAADRFKIKRIHVLDIPDGEPQFIVLYHFSPINRFNFLYETASYADFEKQLRERRESKVQLIDFDRHRVGNEIHYIAVFQDGDFPTFFLSGAGIERVEAVGDSLKTAQNLKLVNLSVD